MIQSDKDDVAEIIDADTIDEPGRDLLTQNMRNPAVRQMIVVYDAVNVLRESRDRASLNAARCGRRRSRSQR